MPELELATTNELLKELLKRFDRLVFIGATDSTDEITQTVRKWYGGHHEVVGMCADMQHAVVQDLYTDMDWIEDPNA